MGVWLGTATVERRTQVTREKILTVTIHDCEVQTFRVGGNGGQKVNKTSSGVRVIHHPSGARGESREQREQARNKREAFIKMVNSPLFRYWLSVQVGDRKSTEQLEAEIAAELTDPRNLRVEVKSDGKWVPE